VYFFRSPVSIVDVISTSLFLCICFPVVNLFNLFSRPMLGIAQVLYHRGWCQAIEMAMTGLNATLLIVHPSDADQYIVNIDPQIIELIQEAKYLQKMNLEVNGSALLLMSNEDRIRKTRET